MKNRNITDGKMSRRSLVKYSTALVGAGMVDSLMNNAKGSNNYTNVAPDTVYNIKNFGATGKREDKATRAVQNAIDNCTQAGGGIVYVPPGSYTVGSIVLKDNVTLHLEAGATFFLSQDSDDFTSGQRAMIFASNAENISITGYGTLDGLAQYEFVAMRELDVEIENEIEIARKNGIDMRRYYRIGMQVYMFILNDCKNILFRDVSIINSPLWTVRMNRCDRVNITGVYIYSDLEKGVNADGIDICSTSNVMISDSVIITADDAIVLKTPLMGDYDGPVKSVENVVVTNCILSSSSTALQIGTETYADIGHVLFDNCTIRNSNNGFGINVQDGCTVHDIIYNNLTIETGRRHWNWWGSSELCRFVLRKRNPDSKLGQIKDVVINNIISHPRGTATIVGHPDQPLQNFRLNNVQMFMLPEDAKDKRASNALEIKNVVDLTIRDLKIKWDEVNSEEKWRSALVIENVNDLEISSFSGRQGIKNSNYPTILLKNVTDVVIKDSKALEGCNTFLKIEGKQNKNIKLRFNDTERAEKEIIFENEEAKNSVKIQS